MNYKSDSFNMEVLTPEENKTTEQNSSFAVNLNGTEQFTLT